MARNLLITLRPGRSIKNLPVSARVLFGRRLLDPSALVRALAAFVIFRGLSSVVNLIEKRRPIASAFHWLSPGTREKAGAALWALAVALIMYRPV